jgi:hypothetical protein
VFTPLLTTDPAVVALCYQAMPLLYRPILLSGLACLATGVVLGVGTHHGLVRHWWVLVKLALNILLTSLVVVLLGPALSDAAELGRQLAAGAAVDVATSNLVFPPIVSGTSLVVATVLAVYKPWGWVRATR